MKSIHTLIPDIQELLKTDGWFTDELAHSLSKLLQFQLNRKESDKNGLTISRLGTHCPKALWHSVHTPELAQPLRPNVKLMFKYGHIIEELAICLAKAAGHTVEGEQDEVSANGVTGHWDAIVDGCVVDFKSANSIGIQKFKDGSLASKDLFGYLEQLDGYLLAGLSDPRVRVKDRGYFLAIDKELGHMVLYEHHFRRDHIRERIQRCQNIVQLRNAPVCECGTKPFGASGNISLDTRASYSPFKHVCFPGLRTFIYAGDKPVYLAKTVREPEVLEVDQYGRRVERAFS